MTRGVIFNLSSVNLLPFGTGDKIIITEWLSLLTLTRNSPSGQLRESSEKIHYALLMTQISKEDYIDFWTFSEIFKIMLDKRKRS
jgi:hypothetical protein